MQGLLSVLPVIFISRLDLYVTFMIFIDLALANLTLFLTPAFMSFHQFLAHPHICLLYTSDAADDMQCVDLGGRRIIKKSKANVSPRRLD